MLGEVPNASHCVNSSKAVNLGYTIPLILMDLVGKHVRNRLRVDLIKHILYS